MFIKPKLTNNITKSFLKDKIFCVTPAAGSDNFLFVLPFLSNKERFIRKIKKIQIVCENNETFKSHFNNILFDKTSNFKKYDNTESSNTSINKDYRKNIFLEYGINKSNQRLNQVKTFSFSASNFEASHLSEIFTSYNNQTSNNDIYLLSLGSSFSKNIEKNGTNQIRYFLFDKDNNIVESSDFFTVDFAEIKQNRTSINRDAFFQEITKNFLKNMSFSLTRINQAICNLRVNFGSSLDEDAFETINFNFSFLNSKGESFFINPEMAVRQPSNTMSIDISNIIPREIAKEYIFDKNEYKIEVKCQLFYKNISDNPDANFISLSNEFNYNKQNSFILKCFEEGKNIAARELLNSISPTIITSITNRKISGQISFSNLTEILKEKVKLTTIRKNSNINIDFYYKSQNFTVEERLFYQNEALQNLVNQNDSIQFFINRFGSRTARIEIVLKLLDVEKVYISDELFFQETFSNLIKETNIKFKNNFLVNDPLLQIGLNESKTNILNFDRMTLQNIQDFNDLALSFGYIDESNQGDIKKFLENCLIKVENSTSLNGNLINVFKSNLFYFKDLFTTINKDSDFANIKSSIINNSIHTDDFFNLTMLQNQDSREQREIIKFFITSDVDNAYKKILNINTSVKSILKVKVLPIPFIITNNIKDDQGNYTGLDSLNNINISDNELRQKLTVEVINFLYSGNSNLNWQKYNKFLKDLFDPTDEEDTPSIRFYEELFSYLLERNTNNLSTYEKQITFNNDSIFNQINVNQNYLETSMITNSYEENLLQNYFNFSYQNSEFNYLEFPFNIGFENVNYFSQNDTVSFNSLKVINDTINKDFLLDITRLKTFYSTNNIRKIVPKIRLSLHFLLTNKEKKLSFIDTENTGFSIVNLGGKDYLTYNNSYMQSDSRFSSFNNFHNCLNNSIVKLERDGEKVLLEIDKDSFSLNINNLNYNIFKDLFDFARVNDATILDKVILRTSIAFTIKNQLDENENITAFFNKELLKINLVDQDNVSINNLSNISSSIIT